MAARAVIASGMDRSTDSRVTPSIREELIVDRSDRTDAARIRRWLSPVAFLVGLPRRLFYLWATGDWWTGPVHRAMQILHVGLAACAAAGLWLARPWGWRHALLLAVPVYLTAFHLIYHVETRYSFPGRPALLLFAGVAAVCGLGLRREGPATPE